MMTADNWLVYGLTPSTDCQVIACRTGDRWESAGSSSSLSESQEVNKMSHRKKVLFILKAAWMLFIPGPPENKMVQLKNLFKS